MELNAHWIHAPECGRPRKDYHHLSCVEARHTCNCCSPFLQSLGCTQLPWAGASPAAIDGISPGHHRSVAQDGSEGTLGSLYLLHVLKLLQDLGSTSIPLLQGSQVPKYGVFRVSILGIIFTLRIRSKGRLLRPLDIRRDSNLNLLGRKA